MNETGRHILVLGLGRSGRAAVELLLREGARVAAYDRSPTAFEGLDPRARRISGDTLPLLRGYDAIVASPGVPVPQGVEVVPEVDLAAERIRAPIVGVTGSNGKSTVTLLVGEMLRASGFATLVGGNLGTPLCAFVGQPADRVVAELSSFQLEHTRRLHARVAVLLNLAPDHLDRHGSLEAYGRAKARLAELQGTDDVLVANLDDGWASDVARRAPARVHGTSTTGPLPTGTFVEGGNLVVAREGAVQLRIALAEIARPARTPVANALAATAAALAAGATPEAVRSVLARFEGLPHRAREVCVRGEVRYVDDSKATNPAAAAACLGAQDGPVVWIAGGRNKGLAFDSLVAPARRTRALVAYGEAAQDLAHALQGTTEIVVTGTLAEAVAAAARIARAGDTVVLSPACASFDQFRDFEERGDRFAELARALPDAAGAHASRSREEGARC
jgi:UDP-N-acetylmuramoylalanine--D-glutamate ligase